MRALLSLLFALLLCTTAAQAQYRNGMFFEVGVSIGNTSFLGDLGGNRDIGRAFVYDLDLQTTRPALGAVVRLNLNERFSWRNNLYVGYVWGDDQYTAAKNPADGRGWSRFYRNLHFRSPIVELSTMLEFNLFSYDLNDDKKRFTPYVLAGIGLFYFDPRAKLNGVWVRLQPLGTEGQGLPEYPEREKYSLVQVAFPLGAGFRYRVNGRLSLNFEMAHRFTTTDYIDDVSTTYVDPAHFYASLSPAQADLAAGLYDQSSGAHPGKTAPGVQRGDPSDNDGYTFGGVITLIHVIRTTSGQLFCPRGF